MSKSLPSAERYRRIGRLFDQALERTTRRRALFLTAACGTDRELRREVELLLAADRQQGGLLDGPLVGRDELDAEDQSRDLVGQRLGAYRLFARQARGGMGQVYLASRADQQFDRHVAVKILHQRLVGTEAQARFHTERAVLARLEHPGIARLYDGGTTEDGRPFLVMEQIDGLPIDQYAQQHRLSLEARLDLMLAVCGAVDFAHRNFVVHRDLKPGNILVTRQGESKLIDFGIAASVTKEPARQEPRPSPPDRWLTPSYASPEQLRGEPVTTASDVYSLGVVLYELLTGASPYPETTQWESVEQVVCKETPVRPSEVLKATGGGRRRLRGDLDAIVLKALEKDPRQRYATVAELAADLKCFLRSRPVRARNGGRIYRLGKLLRRLAGRR